MSLTTEELLDAALALPDPDRLEFVEVLAASLQPADRMPFDESWRDVIQRRTAELRNGTVAGIPWADVKRKARRRRVAEVLFHPEAQAEYECALGCYQARSVRSAARFEAEVERLIELMKAHPDMFPPYDDEHRVAVLRRLSLQRCLSSRVGLGVHRRSAAFGAVSSILARPRLSRISTRPELNDRRNQELQALRSFHNHFHKYPCFRPQRSHASAISRTFPRLSGGTGSTPVTRATPGTSDLGCARVAQQEGNDLGPHADNLLVCGMLSQLGPGGMGAAACASLWPPTREKIAPTPDSCLVGCLQR